MVQIELFLLRLLLPREGASGLETTLSRWSNTSITVTRRSEASMRVAAVYEIIKPRKTWMLTEIYIKLFGVDSSHDCQFSAV